MALSDLRGTQSLFSQRKSDVIYRQAAVFFRINSERKKILQRSVIREKRQSGSGVFCVVVMKLPILRGVAVFFTNMCEEWLAELATGWSIVG